MQHNAKKKILVIDDETQICEYGWTWRARWAWARRSASICRPAVEPVTEVEPKTEELCHDARGNGEVILVVEDEPSVRNLVKSICVRSGYQVLEAKSGDEALEIFQQPNNRVDLVLTDMVMPGSTSGKDLAERLRVSNPELKVIFTSGYSREADKDFLHEGVKFLHKPYHPPALREMIHKFINAQN